MKTKHLKFLNTLKNGNRDQINLILPHHFLFLLSLHLKLATPFSNIKLTDLFGYETPLEQTNNTSSVIFSFTTPKPLFTLNVITLNNPLFPIKMNMPSISSLFLTANWLERELMEMHGFHLHNKEDSRNLMLPYGDASSPLQKIIPSIGLREIFFDSVNDVITSRPTSIQF
uniref:Nad9 n=1 Tax=Urostyla grandis TaxID=57509 RepID=A0A2I4PEP4_9SPIT|nr:Nad9 [Urostyla grandis]